MATKQNSILMFAALAFGVAFTSLTTLRFEDLPVGISEIVILTCMVLHLPLSFGLHIDNGPRYFAAAVFMLFIATLPGFLITTINDGTVDFAMYNLLAMGYIVLFVSYLHYGFNFKISNLENLLVFFVMFSMLYFIGLLLLLYFDPNLVYKQDLDLDIDTKEVTESLSIEKDNFEDKFRLVGFSENPNQLALHALIVSIFTLMLWRKMGTLLSSFCLLTTLVIGVLTQSDAFLFSACILVFTAVIMGIVFGRSVILGLSILVPSVVAFALFFRPGLAYFKEIAEYGEQDETRFTLWMNGIEAGLTRPLTGMGPGTWSGENGPFEFMEAHNTAIDYFSMAGAPGTVLLIVVISYLSIGCLRAGRSTLLAGFIAIAVYGSFHNILRHPIAWLAIYAIANGIWMASQNHGQRSRNSKRRRRRKGAPSRGLDL